MVVVMGPMTSRLASRAVTLALAGSADQGVRR